MSELEQLDADREAAWRAYNDIQRLIPDCEHVRAWRQQIEQARGKHQAAIRACDRALRKQQAPVEAGAAPAAPEPATVPDAQVPLFELEGAA